MAWLAPSASALVCDWGGCQLPARSSGEGKPVIERLTFPKPTCHPGLRWPHVHQYSGTHGGAFVFACFFFGVSVPCCSPYAIHVAAFACKLLPFKRAPRDGASDIRLGLRQSLPRRWL